MRAAAQIAPPPERSAGLLLLRDFTSKLPSDGGVEVIFDLQTGNSRRLTATAFSSPAFVFGDGVGGFVGADSAGKGFQRHFLSGSPVQDFDHTQMASWDVGLGRTLPTLYLVHFVRSHAAIFDLTTLTDGGISFRVKRDRQLVVLTEQAIEAGAEVFTEVTFVTDHLGRVTKTRTQSEGWDTTATYTYSESGAVPWFVPSAVTDGQEEWLLLNARLIPQAEAAEYFARDAVIVRLARLEAELKQSAIDRAGGFDVVAKQSVQDVLPIEGGGSGGRYFWIAGVVAAVGVVGVVVLVRKRRLAA
jgi:hypothetical protein